jgi:hypothetical protein
MTSATSLEKVEAAASELIKTETVTVEVTTSVEVLCKEDHKDRVKVRHYNNDEVVVLMDTSVYMSNSTFKEFVETLQKMVR